MKRALFVLSTLLLPALVTSAHGASLPEAPNVTIIYPTAVELAAAYPVGARRRNIQGFVQLLCTIRSDQLVDCTTGQWSPPGYGFENAAEQIAAKLQIRSNDAKRYVASRFNLQVRFPADPPTETSGPPTPTFGPVQAGLDNLPAHIVDRKVTVIPPDPDEVSAVFPDAARGANVGGLVVLDCTVLENDGVQCTISMEQPPGYGFGDAALELATKIRVRSNDQHSHVGYRLNIPIRFPPDPPQSAGAR